jgi:hypothetical protein
MLKDIEGWAFLGSHGRGRRFETCSAHHERRGQGRGAMAATAEPPEHWREDRAGDDGVGQPHELLDRRRHLRTSRSTLRPRQFAAAGSPTPKRSCVPTAPSRRRSCGHRRSPPRTIWECWCLGLYLLFWGDEALHHMHRYYAFRLARMRRAWFSDGFRGDGVVRWPPLWRSAFSKRFSGFPGFWVRPRMSLGGPLAVAGRGSDGHDLGG